MSDEPSPRPWRCFDKSEGTACVVDVGGVHVCDATKANAALIVDAVNFYDRTVDKQLVALLDDRDRLRDIVKRIEEEMERCHRRDGGISQELMDAVYEARAAIGEDAP